MTRSPLVDAETLAAELDGPRPPLLLDVRWRLGSPPLRDDYLAGHLPGAVWVDLDTDLAAPPGAGGRHPLPAPQVAQDALRRLGVSGSRGVVAYDDTDGSVAARAWWLLRWLGHPDVRLLDGGLRSWTGAGLPLQTGEVPPTAGDLTVRPGVMPVLDADAAGRLARDGVLLDVRAGERYRGEVEPVDPVAGHVPGARSAPSTGNVGPDGRFLDPAGLRARFAGLGVTGAEPVGAYCGSGVTAAHTVLALAVAGIDAALYAGSWSDSVTDPSRPVAIGEG
jgi:thiosulfate/3-mercaptopyruvate sulfurtransferase